MRSWVTSMCEVCGVTLAAGAVASMFGGPVAGVAGLVAGVGLVVFGVVEAGE